MCRPSRKLINRQDMVLGLCYCLIREGETGDSLYEGAIEPAVADLELSAVRSQDIFGDQDPPEGIWHWLERAEVVIADVGVRDANVLYILGMCVALQLPVLLFGESRDQVPYDARHYPFIHVAPNAEGLGQLRQELGRWLSYSRVGEK